MTEHEHLVERISAAMAKAEPNIGATRAMIEAAIAECEKDREGTEDALKSAVLALSDLNEIRRKLDSQCAEMRAALETVFEFLRQEYNELDPTIGESFSLPARPVINAVITALSTDAGEKVLEVVKEAEYLVNNIRENGMHDNWKGVANAISALRWKP